MRNFRKKAFAVLLVCLMMISVFPVSAFAADELIISAEKVTALPGSEISVNINIANNPGISSLKLNVTFDNILTLNSVTYNNEMGGQTVTPQSLKSPVTLTWVSPFANYNSEGVFVTLNFTVSETATPGKSSEIVINYDPNDIYNMDETNVPCKTANGSVTLAAGVPGDINGDQVTNNKDITRMFQYLAGWNVYVNTPVLDTNGDGSVNNKDLTRLFQYLADWDVEIFPNVVQEPEKCNHNLESVQANAPTCEQVGNTAYWHCTLCDRYYSDVTAETEITLDKTILSEKGHTVVVDSSIAATTTSTGLTEGSHCSVCGKVLVQQNIIPVLTYEYSIEYEIAGNDTYLATKIIDNSKNPLGYNSADGTINLVDLVAPDGYVFLGWYDAPQESVDAVKVKKIIPGSKGNEKLYAHWTETVYDITYKLYQTPLGAIEEERYLHYTVSKGLTDLPNPELYNYIFLGWYKDDGTEVTNIPVGTTGNITLNAYWTSKRNLTKAVSKLSDPIICEDTDNGVIYIAYEIGTIENVPLTDNIWTIQSVAGLAQQKSETVSKNITTEHATNISESISKATIDSATWTLSENWNNSTSVNETWAEQNGMTVEEAETKAKTSSNTYTNTSSKGNNGTKTTTDGTTTLKYGSKITEDSNAQSLDVKIGGSYSNENNLTSKIAGTYKVDASVEGGFDWGHKETDKSGTDKTTVDTTVDSSTSTWNEMSSSSNTYTASQSTTVSKALSQIISNTKGYGKTYSHGGSGSESLGLSTTDSKSVSSSSTLTYSTSTITTTTTTYSTDGKRDGCYRLVIAGKIHVFGVVGYDVASKSYFTYTYNVLDDKTYEFLDYSPNLNFNDYENGVIPFEVPYFVNEYISEKIGTTSGLVYTTDTSTGTATVAAYTGTDTDVIIPSYISSSGKSYKVTGLKPSVFSGKNIRSVILSDYINGISAGAFKDCTKLEMISGYFTEIGESAFSGCTSLENFNVSTRTTYIGSNAFVGVNKITVNAIDTQSALKIAKQQNPNLDEKTNYQELMALAQEKTQELVNAAVNSGANNITLDISSITSGTILTLDVPNINRFELKGGLKTYNDLKLESKASTTIMKELTINNCTRIPLEIASEELQFDAVTVRSPGFVLLLSAANPSIILTRDNRLISSGENAVVWRKPTLSSEIVDNTMGVLSVSGNVYVYGDIIGKDNMVVSNGAFIYITEAEFESYIKGSFKVLFDANGGIVDSAEKTIFYGNAMGVLPMPYRDFYTFNGWYTKPNGGEKITEGTIITFTNDITLYAHWTQNPVSDWVLASKMPSGAEIIDEKWTYTKTETTTSTSASLSGWTQTGSFWQQTATGTWYYGSYPSGFNTGNSLYSKYNKSALTAYTNDTTKREVSAASFHTYIYWHWHYDCGSVTANDRLISAQKGTGSNGMYYGLFAAFESSTNYGHTDSNGTTCSEYYCNRGNKTDTSWWWFRFNINKQTYTDYQKVYNYKKVTNHESETAVTASGNISNVNKMVKYRAK